MIHIVPRDRARAAMAHAGPGASLISIRSFVPSGLESDHEDPLADLRPTVISFDDVDRDLPRHGYVAPTKQDVGWILTAGREHRRRSPAAPLVIHCAAGISRSAAAAITIAAARWADSIDDEDVFRATRGAGAMSAVADVLGWLDVTEDAGLRRGGIHPNMAIIRHADASLFMLGALIEAVEGVPWAGTHDRFTRRLIAERLRGEA